MSTTIQRQAQAREPEVVQSEVLAPRAISPQGLVEDFLAEQDISEASRQAYKRSLRQFVLWLQDTGRASRMESLHRVDIVAYRDSLQSSGKSAYTVSSYLVAVRRFYQWLESNRIFPDITRGVRGARKPKGFRKEILSQAQLRQALGAIQRSNLDGLRDYAMLNLLARTGLRTVEVARASVGDISQAPECQADERILWIQGKGRDAKDEFVLLTKEAWQPIQDYLRARGWPGREEALFCSYSDRNAGEPLTTRSLSRIVKQALRAIGLDDLKLTAHSMRHTAISLAVLGGASLQQAQAMARHSDPKITLTYFHNLERVIQGAERCIRF